MGEKWGTWTWSKEITNENEGYEIIKNYEKVNKVFGYFPTFHDDIVTGLSINKNNLILTIETKSNSLKEKGFYKVITKFYWYYPTLKSLYDDLKDILQDKIEIDNKFITITYHNDFIVKIKLDCWFKVYINDKYFYNIEDQDIYYFIEDIVNDNYVIIEYKNKHGFYNRNFFKFIYKTKFNKDKYSTKKIKRIFDINTLLNTK